VRLYVSDDLIQIGPDATLHQIAQRLAAEGVGALVVVHGDGVLGVISERDVIRAVAAVRISTRSPRRTSTPEMW
jgi:CBS domain-containing protein